MTDLLVVAAPEEARHLPSDVELLITGIGMVEAAVAVTRALCERRPDRVVNLGSVGSLEPDLTGIQYPSRVINRDVNRDTVAVLGGQTGAPIDLAGDGPVLGTGSGLVAGGGLRDGLQGQCQLVDMEGYAIAYACRTFGINLVMVKHVSDQAADDALDWYQVVDRSARALAAEYQRIRNRVA